jgi:hypothetical protein
VRLDEVLGALDEERLAEDQGGADRVGPDVALGPGRTLDESEVVGHPADAGVAAAPEHPTLGVGDHHELARVDDRCEQLHEPGHHRRERGQGTPVLQLGDRQRCNLGAAGWVQPDRRHPAPRGRDLTARSHRSVLAGQDGVPAASSFELGVVHEHSFPPAAGVATPCNPVPREVVGCVLPHTA